MAENESSSDEIADDVEAIGGVEPIYLHVGVTDPEVVSALSEVPAGAARNELVLTALKVGILSLRAAKGVVDGAAIRSAGDHLIQQLAERLNGYRSTMEEGLGSTLARYFDPTNGAFPARVESLVKADGELSRLIQMQMQGAQQGLDRLFERFLGDQSEFLSLLSPSDSNRLLQAMRETVGEVARAEKDAIVSQFSLDNKDGALNRLVKELTEAHGEVGEALRTQIDAVVAEFSLDSPDSALSRLVGRVESAQRSISSEFSLDNEAGALTRLRKEMHTQIGDLAEAQTKFHTEVVSILSSMNARKQAEARSTTHGQAFEEAVVAQLRSLGGPAGDIVESVGSSTGVVRNSKVGDAVVILPPDSQAAGARIVVEAKESGAYSLRSTLDEADEARRNRSAQVCLFVHSAATAPAGLEPLGRYGNDIVIVWDAENQDSDVVFKAGYLAAKALSIRAAAKSSEEAASLAKIEKAIEVLRKQLAGFDELTTTSQTIQNGSNKMLDRIRIMRGEIEKQVEVVAEQFDGMKGGE